MEFSFSREKEGGEEEEEEFWGGVFLEKMRRGRRENKRGKMEEIWFRVC